MNWKLTRKPGHIPLAFAILITALAAVYLPRSWLDYHQAAKQVEHARLLLSTEQDFLSQLKDAETGQRGFLLTRKARYLEPYQSTLTSLFPLLQQLGTLGGSNGSFQTRLTELTQLTRQKLNIIQASIRVATTEGTAAALSLIETDQGKEVMDRIRAVVAELELQESKHLDFWQKRSQHLAYQTLILGGGSVLLLASFLLLAALASQRAHDRELELIEHERASQYALQKSEARFRSMADSAPVLLWIAGTDQKWTYFNKGWLGFTGRSLEQEAGLGWMENIHPDDFKRCSDILRRSFADREPFLMEYRLRRHDGEYRWVMDHGVPMYLENGELTGYAGSSVDIHERKGMEEEMERRVVERTEQLRYKEEELMQSRKMEAIGRLAGGVAHDFNNLLTGISGIAEEVREELTAGHARESMDEILKAVQRAAALTKQLLAFGRRQIAAPVVLNINNALPEMTGMLKRLIGEDIQLVTLFGAENVNVRMDAGQLEQVVINLVLNARDAMPQGGKISIETAAVLLDENYAKRHFHVVPGPYVMLAVSDTGIGIDEQTQEHIFEPFFTTKEAGRGSGMGLATVYGIVKQNNGDIFLYSTVGAGTTIKIYLPRTSDPAETIRPPRPEVSSGTETVLLVEDEDLVRRVASRALIRRGYKLLEARNGKEALEIAASYSDRIHLLFTDVIMPGLNGRQVAELLAAQRPEMKVLYTSGYTENIIVQRGMLKPGISFIEKSFTAATVCAKVREVLDAPSPL